MFFGADSVWLKLAVATIQTNGRSSCLLVNAVCSLKACTLCKGADQPLYMWCVESEAESYTCSNGLTQLGISLFICFMLSHFSIALVLFAGRWADLQRYGSLQNMRLHWQGVYAGPPPTKL